MPLVIDDISELADDADEVVRQQIVQTLGLLDSAAASQVVDPILRASAVDEKKLHGLIGGFLQKTQQNFWRLGWLKIRGNSNKNGE